MPACLLRRGYVDLARRVTDGCDDGRMDAQRGAGRPRRPAFFGPAALDTFVGAPDPALRVEAAHATAEALLRHGRDGGDDVAARLVAITDVHGIDEVAELWADTGAETLPGALWRLYALRAGIRQDPLHFARAFESGRLRAPVHEAVAGVGEPPGGDEVVALADAVLTGVFTGDFAVALERAAAFCRVVSTGQAVLADDVPDALPADVPDDVVDVAGAGPAARAHDLTRRAADLLRTAGQLEASAALWRAGRLH